MKTHLLCIPCLQNHAIKTVQMIDNNEEVQKQVLLEVMQILLETDWEQTPVDFADAIYGVIGRVTGIEDPYESLKRFNNDEALKIARKIKNDINKLDNKKEMLKMATLAAIGGNIIDFGPNDKFDIDGTVKRVLEKEVDAEDYSLLEDAVLTGDKLLYFADNAGEIVFDKLYLETLLKVREKPFQQITFVVKGCPIMNDAMMEDAIYIGLDKIPNITFKLLGKGDGQTGPKRGSVEVKKWLEEHDVIISKGQANFEGFSDYKKIFFLFLAKCSYMASLLGVEQGSVVIKYNYA